MLIGRVAWGARSPRDGISRVEDHSRSEFIVHHSGGPADQSVRSIQDWCMDDRHFLDIDYNFLIGQAGQLYVGRGWSQVGSHARKHNRSGWGVCVIGTNVLSEPAAMALQALYAEAVGRAGHALHVMGHRQVDQTDCPGPKISAWLDGGGLRQVQPRDLFLLPAGMLHGVDVVRLQRKVGVKADGWFGPDTEAAVRGYQHRHGLVVDGIVGPRTRAAMGL